MARECRRAWMGSPALLAAAALLILLPASAAGPRQLQVFLASNAGPYQDNSLLGVPDEVDTGESFGSDEKVNVCKFQLGDVNNWILKPEIQYTPIVAQAILETSGRGSFIAPAVGFLHYGPSCYLYDHVCNFNYQEPCNLRGDCQTNNTCFCTNGWKTCVPNDGTITSASAGCETYVYGDPNNCGQCGNVCQSGFSCNGAGSCVPNSTPSPPPPPPGSATPPSTNSSSNSSTPVPSSGDGTGGGTGLQTPGVGSTTGVGTPGVGTPSTGAGPSSSSASGPPSTGASGSSVAGPSQTGFVPSGNNVPANSSPAAGEGPGSSNSPDTGGSILGSTPASSTSQTGGAATNTAGVVTNAAGATSISDSGIVVPGSTTRAAARKAARQAADAAAAAGRRLLDLAQRL